jgi:probable rRNA maturation factor
MITIDPPSSSSTLPPAPKPALTRFLHRARAAVGLPGTVSVLLTSDAELQRLNRQFRRKNKPTDVLSFPADPIPGLPLIHQHAGDLAISLETAGRQAAEHGHSLPTELRILVLHGLLHLSGLDHETDSGEMASREAELRSRFRLPNTLIARTLAGPLPPRVARKAARGSVARGRSPQLRTGNKRRSTP